MDLAEAVFQTPGNKPASMTYRPGTSDWNTLNACMTEDEYVLRGRRLRGWALDIGAHIGGVTVSLALDNPDLHVIAVEAVPPNVELLRANVRAAGVEDRVVVIEGAVGCAGAPVDVWYGYRGSEVAEHHAYIGNCSLAYDNGGALDHETAHYDFAVTLDELLGMTGGERIALAKVDVEGGEYAFLDTRAVSAVDEFVGEWHPVRGNTRDSIVKLLGRTHALSFNGPEEGPGGFCAVTL
jgi:FkbM family methyltransferase